MASTGAGWAQLRQQARQLESQVRLQLRCIDFNRTEANCARRRQRPFSSNTPNMPP